MESLKQLRLPKLASNFEISTNPSSVKKDKRSQSTIRGVHSRATLISHENQGSSIRGIPRDFSVATIQPVIDGSNQKIQGNISRFTANRNSLIPPLNGVGNRANSVSLVPQFTKPSTLGRNTLEQKQSTQLKAEPSTLEVNLTERRKAHQI